MSKGYNGKVLRVNLTTGRISTETFDDAWYRTYLGGWGLIAYVLLREVPADCDPLGPLNKLIIAPGVMTGLPVGGSGRSAVGAKSPLTGGFGEGDVGGFFAAELKHAGWDGIIVEGMAEKPVYLWIKDDQVEIRDARHLWGKKTGAVEEIIKADLSDDKIRVCQIGPGGENLTMQACVLNDITHAAGRCGLGAVMGSKKLRAIACRGSGKPEIADPEKIKKWARWQAEQIKVEGSAAHVLHDHGTDGFLMGQQVSGGLPTRNFIDGAFEGAEAIDGVTMTNTILKSGDTCYACPVRCKRVIETHDEWGVDPLYGGPEYETAGAFGSMCGVDNLPAVCKANEHCNAYGLDTIEVGCTIAWAMECFEKGILTLEDTGGMDLHFGNAKAIVDLTEQIALRQGFGAVLAEGSYRAAEKIGPAAMACVVHAKKQEVPMHDPRVKHALDIGYAISPTGADHVHNIHDTGFHTMDGIAGLRAFGIHNTSPYNELSPTKVRMTKRWINNRIFYNCVGLCNFMSYSSTAQVELVAAATGWDFSMFEMLEIGERCLAMARVFNYRAGLTAKDDVPPRRFSEPTGNGPAQGRFVPKDQLDAALSLYYDMMGWDHETGAPVAWKLYDLGLDWLV
jgi:aldehyde:ferredoxin oxidoreductase